MTPLPHKELKSRALERPDVKKEHDRLEREFAYLDESLKARAAPSLPAKLRAVYPLIDPVSLKG